MARVLVIGDLHLPAERKDYLEFCKGLRKKYRTNKTVFIGDVVDHHAISFHHKHPEEDAAMAEYHRTMKALKEWKKTFKEAFVCIENHDERVQRIGASAGIPPMYLKSYAEVFNTPNWSWDYEWILDGVAYMHGTGASSAACPAFTKAVNRMQSVVMGHIHSNASICWTTGVNGSVFGFNVGCGVDRNHKMMHYGSNFLKKPVNSAGVVIDGKPYLELMD